MPPFTGTAAKVLLVGADPAAVAALQPSAETLAAFGLRIETVVAADGKGEARFDEACAVIVADPDGALATTLATVTTLPVIRVPTATVEHSGCALLTNRAGNLPAASDGAAFATMAIGVAGAKNAALFVVAILAPEDERLRAEYAAYRARQTADVLHHPPLEL